MYAKEAIDRAHELGIREWLYRELYVAFVDARKGKLKTRDEHVFEVNALENIGGLRDAILEKRYHPGSSKAFVVFKPMVREIFAAKFRDRVVHHFLFNAQAGWWERRLDPNSFACIKGRGTLYGIKKVQRMMRQAMAEANEMAKLEGKTLKDKKFIPRVIKLDLTGYFMSLDRELLYKRIKWGLDRQFADYLSDSIGYQIYKICLYLWKEVIFDNPVPKARRKGDLKNWDSDILPPRKSLFCQPYGIGIVIGNLTSQLMSNIFLDQLDRFVRKNMSYARYGRYVDDFVLIVHAKDYEQAKRDVGRIEEFLKNELKLKLHPEKRYYQDITKGVEFIGARIYPNSVYPSDRLQSGFRRAAMEVAYDYGDATSLEAYLGIMTHLNAGKLIDEVFNQYGWK